MLKTFRGLINSFALIKMSLNQVILLRLRLSIDRVPDIQDKISKVGGIGTCDQLDGG